MSDFAAEDENDFQGCDNDASTGLAFIIVSDLEPLNCDAVVAAAEEMGLKMKVSPPSEEDDDGEGEQDGSPDITSFDLEGDETLLVMLLPMPHPDVDDFGHGPFSPEDMDALSNGPGHYVVTLIGMEGTVDEADTKMSAATSCVMAGLQPLGVLKMPGLVFHRPEFFSSCAKQAFTDGELPLLICVDVTAAQESETHMSFLTHNMERYGRENFYIVSPSEGTGALNYTLNLTAWMLSDRDYHLPTGDTVGRTADEKIKVQRVANPTGEGPEVIRLDLP